MKSYTVESKEAIATGEPELIGVIRAEIEKSGGSIPFKRFMELALYHPRFGYYVTGALRTGRQGDFFTSVSVGPLFGCILAKQFQEFWVLVGKPRDFWLIEQGAMDGRLMRDVFEAISKLYPDFSKAVKGLIIEPFEKNEIKQKETLQGHNVEWNRELGGVKKEVGVFYSNELVDSFPFHLIVFRSDEWLEQYVALDGERFVIEEKKIHNERLLRAIDERNIPKIPGYTTEVNLAAEEWIEQVAQVLEKGFVLTIDYGFDRETYYSPARSQGTFQCYMEHRCGTNPLEEVGLQDITSHVDFSTLVLAGKTAGLKTIGLVNQNRFCMGVTAEEFKNDRTLEELFGEAGSVRAWQTLASPSMMGERFQFLLQAKGIECGSKINGMRFARNAGIEDIL